jgi:transcription termination factor Rho
MDNEKNEVKEPEKAARPVRKLVLKKKPTMKVSPKATTKMTAQVAQVVQTVQTVQEPEVKQPEVEKPEVTKVATITLAEDVAPKKKRGRKPKNAKAETATEQPTLELETEVATAIAKAIEKVEEEKPAEPVEVVVEAAPVTEATTEATAETTVETTVQQTNEQASEQAGATEQAENLTDNNQHQKFQKNQQNQNQQRNQNQKGGKDRRNFDQNQNQKQRNNQKKTLTMEDVSISEEEYQEHLKRRILVSDVSQMSIPALKEKLAELAGTTVDDYAEYKKQEIIVEIIRTYSQNNGVIYATGTLEILNEGYGFLRSPLNSYLPGPEDVYVSPAIIRFLNLKTGDTIEGLIRNPKENEKFFALSRIATVNDEAPIIAKTRVSFDSLVPLYPDQRINLETERTDNDVSMRIINLFCPIGKGQRALITAPPRTGKTILLQQIANAITTNHPEIKLMVLLVDERPEEVTDMRRNVKGEVIASTFDEQATRHVTVAEMVIEKAKRLVEHKKDVVILLDSITRLARAYNQTVPASGKILSGGVDSNALHKPKRFFGAARNIENGGSLTIIASALIETGSRMDEVIFEEFKGTGNSEIVLDRRMADRRLYPAINIKKSGTRREDLLLDKDEAARIWILRNAINGLEDLEMTEFLIDKMRKTKNNEAFLRSMNTGTVPAF